MVTKHKTILFADDTTILIKSRNLEILNEEVTNTLNDVMEWLNANNLEVNLSKTKIIYFNTGRIPKNYIPPKVGETLIRCETSVKYLGIMIDEHLNWKEHVKMVCDKLAKFVFAIRRLRLTVSQNAALVAYHGYVASTLTYGLLLWGNSVDIIQAFKMQKKAVRALCGKGPMDSCRPLFKKLNLLTLTSMYIRAAAIFVKEHSDYFEAVPEATSLRLRAKADNYKFNLPRCRLQMVKRNAHVNIINIFNNLPISLKELPLSMFKKKLTVWLINNNFYSLSEYYDTCI